MLSQAKRKYLTSLHHGKYRREHGEFVVEGDKLVRELLGQNRFAVTGIWAEAAWALQCAEVLRPYQALFTEVSRADLEKVTALQTPNQVLATVQMPPPASPALADLSAGYHFYLDGLQDPGNVGTILRIADWFGFASVGLSADTADVFSPKVVQSTMGALWRVAVWEGALAAVKATWPNLPLVGAAMDGQPLRSYQLPATAVLVIGNEGKGIRADTAAALTATLRIERPPQGHAESLNAAVAAGILAHWAVWNTA